MKATEDTLTLTPVTLRQAAGPVTLFWIPSQEVEPLAPWQFRKAETLSG